MVKLKYFQKAYDALVSYVDQGKRITYYLMLIFSVVIPTIALAFLLELGIIETVLLLPFFPLVISVILFVFLVLFGTAFAISEVFSKRSIDWASSIPLIRFNARPFFIASSLISFTFFTLFILLSPQELLSSIPILNSRNLGKVVLGLFSQTYAIDESITLFVQFLFFPILGSVTLLGIKFYRNIVYGFNDISAKERNKAGQGFVNSLKVLLFVSLVLLLFSTLMGSSPSGYPITDYYFWLLFIIIPGSIISAWISRFIGKEIEIGTNSASRKLATLRAAIGLMEAESKHDMTSEKVVVELQLDAYEKFALDRLGDGATQRPAARRARLMASSSSGAT